MTEAVSKRSQWLQNEAFLVAIADQLGPEDLMLLANRCYSNEPGVPDEVLSSLTVVGQDILRGLMATSPGRIQVARAIQREQEERREQFRWQADGQS
jgi:hypothetical protein